MGRTESSTKRRRCAPLQLFGCKRSGVASSVVFTNSHCSHTLGFLPTTLENTSDPLHQLFYTQGCS